MTFAWSSVSVSVVIRHFLLSKRGNKWSSVTRSNLCLGFGPFCSENWYSFSSPPEPKQIFHFTVFRDIPDIFAITLFISRVECRRRTFITVDPVPSDGTSEEYTKYCKRGLVIIKLGPYRSHFGRSHSNGSLLYPPV